MSYHDFSTAINNSLTRLTIHNYQEYNLPKNYYDAFLFHCSQEDDPHDEDEIPDFGTRILANSDHLDIQVGFYNNITMFITKENNDIIRVLIYEDNTEIYCYSFYTELIVEETEHLLTDHIRKYLCETYNIDYD